MVYNEELIWLFISDVKRGQNLEAEAESEAEAKNNYEKSTK